MMGSTAGGALALQLSDSLSGFVPLDERELATIEGGNIWAGVGVALGGAGLALLLGVGIGVAVYCIFN